MIPNDQLFRWMLGHERLCYVEGEQTITVRQLSEMINRNRPTTMMTVRNKVHILVDSGFARLKRAETEKKEVTRDSTLIISVWKLRRELNLPYSKDFERAEEESIRERIAEYKRHESIAEGL